MIKSIRPACLSPKFYNDIIGKVNKNLFAPHAKMILNMI